MKARDARDSERQTAPLGRAADAFELDTTALDADAAFAAAADFIAGSSPSRTVSAAGFPLACRTTGSSPPRPHPVGGRSLAASPRRRDARIGEQTGDRMAVATETAYARQGKLCRAAR